MRKQAELVGNGETDPRLGQDRDRAVASSEQSRSLQFLRKFADEVLDLLRLMPMANEKRVRRPHDDQVMHAEQRDVRAVWIRRQYCSSNRAS